MGKNSIDVYGAEGKSNALFFDPEKLVLVTDPKHPLYDKRVHLPVREKMVLNIMHQGVLQAILITKDPESGEVQVVAGRQRVKAAREANRRLREKGCEPVLVPAMVRSAKADDRAATMAGVMVSENEIREDDTPLGRAEKMAQLRGYGRSEDSLAVLFGCTPQTVRNTLALLECPQVVREAVESGKVNVGHALALSKLDPAEQREKVKALINAGETTKGHAKARAQRAIVSPDKPRMKTKREIREAMEEAKGARKEALAWVLGE